MSNNKPSWVGRTAIAATVGAASLGMPGCEPSSSPGSNSSGSAHTQTQHQGPNLYDILTGPADKNYRWIDANGTEVNIEALKAKLKDKHVTLSFGFQSCTLMCPTINNNLKELGQDNPDLATIVVSVDPLNDGKDAKAREAFAAHLRDEGIRNAITLFPVKASPSGDLVLDPKTTTNAQMRAGAIVNAGDSLAHTSKIYLFLNGQNLATKSGLDSPQEFKEWNQIIKQTGKTGP
ncbi:MAG: SCO family protein [Rickettsiales bacterium]